MIDAAVVILFAVNVLASLATVLATGLALWRDQNGHRRPVGAKSLAGRTEQPPEPESIDGSVSIASSTSREIVAAGRKL